MPPRKRRDHAERVFDCRPIWARNGLSTSVTLPYGRFIIERGQTLFYCHAKRVFFATVRDARGFEAFVRFFPASFKSKSLRKEIFRQYRRWFYHNKADFYDFLHLVEGFLEESD